MRRKKEREGKRKKKHHETHSHVHSGNMRDEIKRGVSGASAERAKVTGGQCNDFFTVNNNNNDGQSEFHIRVILIIQMASDAQ